MCPNDIDDDDDDDDDDGEDEANTAPPALVSVSWVFCFEVCLHCAVL